MLERPDYFEKPDALLMAALNGDAEVGRLLLERGADPNQKDEYGRTALMIVIEEGYAAQFWAELLLEFGADINLLDGDGDSALDLAVFHQAKDAAQFLRDRGGVGKSGPSAKKLRDDSIYQAFADANAVKALGSNIDAHKKP